MITIFDKHTEQNEFDSNGLAIIEPLTATITEEINGRYDYQITAVCDPQNDAWQKLQPYNIIKSSSTGQLFMINKVAYSSSNGYPSVTAYAQHIWYYLADMFTEYAEDTRAMRYAMQHVFSDKADDPGNATHWSHGTGLTDYTFTYDTDDYSSGTDDMRYYKYEHVSLAYAVLGSPDSIINLWGAELHRDNFHFKLARPKDMNNSPVDFKLEYGVNCSNVDFTNDYSERITEMFAYSNVTYSYYGKSIIPDAGTFPHQVMSGVDFSYENETYGAGGTPKFIVDADDYFGKYWQPKQTWDVSFVDPTGLDNYGGWNAAQNIQIGDLATIVDALGHTGKQKVISRKINDITGRVENIKLGSFLNTAGHLDKFDRIISGDYAAYRRIKRLENAQNS